MCVMEDQWVRCPACRRHLTSGKAMHCIARQARQGLDVLAQRRIEATSRSGRSRAARLRQEPVEILYPSNGNIGRRRAQG
jgi:hypothetical protein